MKIESVRSFVVSVPFTYGGPPATFAGRPWNTLDILLVRIDTADGLTGWGEAFGHAAIPSTKAALDTVVAPLFVGRDSGDIRSLMREMQHKVHLLGRNGPYMYALSGIDIALWDIAGKRAKQPLWKMLGGHPKEHLRGYASLVWYGDLALVKRNTEVAVAAGFEYIKLHEVTREAVLAAKSVAPGAKIMLDTNCPWSAAEAVAMARAMRGDDLVWLEEPIWPPEDFESLARVRAEGVPIAAGENASGLFDFKRMFELGAVDIAQPSVTKVGGITEMLRIMELAESRGISVAPHCPYYGPGFLASLHLAACMKTSPLIEVFWIDMEANPFDPWVRAREGSFAIPNGHGLGCDPDPEILARYVT